MITDPKKTSAELIHQSVNAGQAKISAHLKKKNGFKNSKHTVLLENIIYFSKYNKDSFTRIDLKLSAVGTGCWPPPPFCCSASVTRQPEREARTRHIERYCRPSNTQEYALFSHWNLGVGNLRDTLIAKHVFPETRCHLLTYVLCWTVNYMTRVFPHGALKFKGLQQVNISHLPQLEKVTYTRELHFQNSSETITKIPWTNWP